MRFPAYWKRVCNSTGRVSAKGWSENSLEEAEQLANRRLEKILKWLASGKRDEDLDRYSYVIDDCICEPVIDRIFDTHDQEIAVMSRNAYGALVMNAANVMFVDIDVASMIYKPGFWARLRGVKAQTIPEKEAQELDHLRQWQREHTDYGLRVYRTAAGLRVIVTNRIFAEVDSRVLEVLSQLNSDPLYRELCRSQRCFRARLTPKPWRIRINLPPTRYPFPSQEHEELFNQWFSSYLEKSRQFSVCRWLETIGDMPMHDAARQLVELHDQLCCSSQALPLA